ncbi:CopG family transcriptional regulator [Psychrobacillus sp. FSL W7-1457]|uniref:CopG family transcriptional regulator n=1 Tax=unclassified Psychrobacillus TaxID=2636677 RepID=UPI0030FBB191
MAETEKITINMNVVDLGKADLLIEQGFYSNRTDFIKTSIRNQLNTHAQVIDQAVTMKAFNMGVSYYDKHTLELLSEQNKTLSIKTIGMLILANDIDPELALKTIKSVKVYGVLKASPKLKEALQPLMN